MILLHLVLVCMCQLPLQIIESIGFFSYQVQLMAADMDRVGLNCFLGDFINGRVPEHTNHQVLVNFLVVRDGKFII